MVSYRRPGLMDLIRAVEEARDEGLLDDRGPDADVRLARWKDSREARA